MAAVRRPRIVDLSLPVLAFSNELPEFTPQVTRLLPDDTMRRMAKHYRFSPDDIPTGTHLYSELVSLSVHSSTHVDAPSHYGPGPGGRVGPTIDQVPLEWCWGNGVVLDFRGKQGGDLIDVAEVQAAVARLGHTLSADDIVCIQTGWDKRWTQPDYASSHPGLTRAACAWLLEQGVRTIGIDCNSLDVPTPIMVERLRAGDRDQFYQCHYLGREREFLMIEKLANLDQVPPTGFTLVAFPVNIRGCSGGWTRAVGLIDDQSGTAPRTEVLPL